MVDVDVMDRGTRKRTLQVDFEGVGDVGEDRLRGCDENTDPIMASNDFHDEHGHCSVTVRSGLAYLSKNDILSPLYLCLSTRKRVVELDFRLDNEYNHHPQSSPSSSSSPFVVVRVRMKTRSSSRRRMTAYVQGRHHKKPVHIYASEEKRERERERTREQRERECIHAQ